MSTAMLPPPVKRWSVTEFHRLGDAGLFEGQNLILVAGEILEMPVAGAPHDVALLLLEDQVRRCFPMGYTVRNQMSLVVGQTTDPVPDLAVVRGSARDFLSKPTTAVLVAEVADSSLAYDTDDKANLYASAGIADYWVVDLVNRQVVVFRDPIPDPARRFGAGYTTVTTNPIGQSVSPLAAPTAAIAVADLLP